jgi:uncharacterized membrane protein (DUF106 family)
MLSEMVLESFFNSIFGWAVEISPLTGVVVVAFVMTLLVTLIYKFMTDQEAMKNLKQEMKDLRKEIKLAAQDPVKMAELNKISMEKSMQQMKQSLKPTLITMLPLIFVLGWLKTTYEPLTLNLFGITSSLWAYIALSVVFSIVLRKMMKVH